MKFEEVLPGLRAGKLYRRAIWDPMVHIKISADLVGKRSISCNIDWMSGQLASEDLLATDWELTTDRFQRDEPKKAFQPHCDMGMGDGPNRVVCQKPVWGECVCKRCCTEEPDERFYTCLEHVVDVGRVHERIRGRDALWMESETLRATETKA